MHISNLNTLKMKGILSKGSFEVHVGSFRYFVNLTKVGFVIGYKDRIYRAEDDDHWTILVNCNDNKITSAHRTVRLDSHSRYTKVNWPYIENPNGVVNLLEDLFREKSSNTFKIILPMVYYLSLIHI